jgi:hypothetical protein
MILLVAATAAAPFDPIYKSIDAKFLFKTFLTKNK